MIFKTFTPYEYFGYETPPKSSDWWVWVRGEEPNFNKDFARYCWRRLLLVLSEFRGDEKQIQQEWDKARHTAEVAIKSVKNPSKYAIEPWVFKITKGDSKKVIQAYVAYTLICFDKGILALKKNDAAKAAEFFMYAGGGIDAVMAYKRFIQHNKSGTSKLERLHKEVSSKGGKNKRDKSPATPEKELIKKCWLDWQKDASIYKSKSAFARDMLKECEHLTNPETISRWCREWEKEKQRSCR